jgi:hypothetical protein
MQAFTDFILEVMPPPNPIRSLDNSLTPDEQTGRDFYFNVISDVVFECNGCHRLDPAQGFFGSEGLMTFEGETQNFKVAHLRNVYTKIGKFGMPETPGINGGGTNDHRGDQIRGYGVLHDGSIDTVFRFVSAAVFDFPSGEAGRILKRQVESFVFAFDSNFAPIVGQQITLTSTNAATAGPRVDLLVARAAAGECDVVVKGTIDGEPRGFQRLGSGDFKPDRAAEAPLGDAALRALADTAGQELTYTCVPPGSGKRIGIDRDADAALDGDELDAGTNPGSNLSLPADNLVCTNGSVIERASLRVTRNTLEAGDEGITLRGEILLPTPTTVDPRATGFRFKVLDKDDLPLFYGAIGRGDPLVRDAPGWTVNRARTRWVYRDRLQRASRVIRAVVARKPGPESRYRFRAVGRDGDFTVPLSRLPLSLVVVLGGPEEGETGLCGAADFNPSGGPRPSCRASASGATVACN